MKGYIQLIRPLNCAMGAIAVLIAALITSSNDLPESRYIPLIFAMAVVFVFMAGGNTLNDYFDRKTDRVNHPERPIPSRLVKRKTARAMGAALLAVSIVLGLFVNLEALLLVLLNAGIMVAYELRLKRRGLGGNAAIGWLTATLFLFGGLSVYTNTFELQKVSMLVLLAFTATLGREIAKDVQDMKGDVDRKTLPRRIGVRGASALAAFVFIITVLLSLVPLWMELFEYQYILFIVAADVMFIYCGILLFQNPRLTST
ncbi:MAG: UbiA family prenyltransferase, partial [Thermoplasmata archaeon]|nr:UbiA family prenyltransferase [Thermoplasmata archaeon]